MDRAEAIEILAGRYLIAVDTDNETAKEHERRVNEALDLAIEALGQTEGEDCISRQQAMEAFCDDCRGLKPGQCEHWDSCKSQKELRLLPPVAPKEQTDCTYFTNWLLDEVMDEENWELNAVANGEIICRKLKKLGLLEVKDGYYVRASVTPTEQNEEDILKFYYVESLDEYWIGQRCGTRYYGKWTGNCFTYGYSRYLPWGEHVVAPDTLWKEHTYPSEPKEIPFNEWLQGFLEKECQTERTGEWVKRDHRLLESQRECSLCGESTMVKPRYCPNCGAKMGGDAE